MVGRHTFPYLRKPARVVMKPREAASPTAEGFARKRSDWSEKPPFHARSMTSRTVKRLVGVRPRSSDLVFAIKRAAEVVVLTSLSDGCDGMLSNRIS